MGPKSTSKKLLDFWFSASIRQAWFRSTPELDQKIRENWLEEWELASAGRCDDWASDAEGALALVILLDQVPLNIFRGDPLSFSTTSKAIEISKQALAEGWDRPLSGDHLAFLYMPFMHSENLNDQEQSVLLFTAAGLEDNIRFAQHHRDLIRRFGRFPHRNDSLGRESRVDELEYLQSTHAFKG